MFRLSLALVGFFTTVIAVAQDRPYRDFRDHATAYAGPGRKREEPANVSEVLIGYFGPSDPDHPDGGDLWKAAELAVNQANAQGGYKGKPFRLVPAWSDNPWKAGVAKLAGLVYHDRVWAIVGGIDGPSAHLAEQVVAKARLPLVCTVSSDRTANVANVPWMFSVLPGDDVQTNPLAQVLGRENARGYSILSAQDHDSRLFLDALNHNLKSYKSVPRFTHILPADNPDEQAVIRQVVAQDVGAVVVAAGVSDSVRLVRALRSGGFRGRIVGTHHMGRRRFVVEAGTSAEGVLFPLLYDPSLPPPAFHKQFEARYRVQPDYAAAHTYDSLNLLIAAIQVGGLNRARIGDAIRSRSPSVGVTGPIKWDSLGSNTRPVAMGTIRAGRVTIAAGVDGR